ncbi:MAG: type I-E CRISPR-associated protein Cas5/CasD [Bacillota bacterium]
MAGIPILLLWLEGPLQSWGLRSRWDVRDTGDEPSKSGLIGLLGCALGIPVYDPRLEEMDKALTLGVRVEHEGRKMVDYQTVTKEVPGATRGVRASPQDASTIVSPRVYLQDAAFLAAFTGPAELLERCARALEAPRWPVFLGRKSCPPTRPVLERYTKSYSSLEDALRHYPWDYFGKAALQGQRPKKLRCVLEDDTGDALRPDRIRTNPARMYDSRRVKVFMVDFPGEMEDDASCISRA